MFRDMSRKQNQFKINNFFIPWAILKCNMSITSVFLTFLTAYYNT